MTLTITPTDTVTPIEFFDAITGSSPERRARRAEQGRKFAAEQKAKSDRQILVMRERIAALLSPEAAAKAREEWALQDRITADLKFTMELQEQRRVA